MLAMNLWIIKRWLWRLLTGCQVREQFLILFKQRINDTHHLTRQPPNDFLPTDQPTRSFI
jgi:hypothetical protein